MKPETKAQLETIAAKSEVSGMARKIYWSQLAPSAKFEKQDDFAQASAAAFVKAGLIDAKNEKAAVGLIKALGLGNQSALRQLMAKEDAAVQGLAL